MMAEQSHELLSVSWRPTKAWVLLFKGLRAKGVDSSSNSKAREPGVLRAREDQCPISGRQAEGGKIPLSFTFLFYSGPQHIGCYSPTLGWAICFKQSTNSNATLF